MTTQAIDPALTRAYETCRRMHRRFDPTYYWATRRLPEEIRPATHALYGYVRTADQIVDGPRRDGRPEARRAALDAWEAELEAGLATGHSSQPVVGALVDAGRRHRLPLGELRLYMHSMRLDCAPVRIETWDELVGYMEGSAGSVGRIMAPLLGIPEAHHAGFGTLALAFQHANFIRDVREDRKLDRIFVTGGSGFVGGRLIERLARDGWTVRALARSDRAADAVRTPPAPSRCAASSATFSALVRRHGGRRRRASTPPPRSRTAGRGRSSSRANVEGTRNVLARLPRRGASARVVHVSTEAVLMHGQPLVHVDETLSARAASRRRRTRARRRWPSRSCSRRAATGSRRSIVRPRFVWGRGDTTLLPLLVEGTRAGASAGSAAVRQRTVDHPRRQHRRGPAVRRRARAAAARIYFVTDGDPVVVPRLRRRR